MCWCAVAIIFCFALWAFLTEAPEQTRKAWRVVFLAFVGVVLL